MHPWQLLERLTDRDLEFLAPGQAAALRRYPDLLESALDAPQVCERIAGDPDVLLHASPQLLFHVLLRRVLRDLGAARYTLEASGPRRRVPVFDAAQVHGVLAQPDLIDYLADMLASFTRVQSGSTWVRTKRGLRRRRFSELDLESLEALEADLGDEERFHLDRRIGDLTLLLTGVFPDAAIRTRLHRPSMEEVERTGARRYERAAHHPLASRAGEADVLATLAAHYRLARKALNFLTDRYLYPFRTTWFPAT